MENNEEQAIHFIEQLQALGDLAVIIAYGAGVIFVILGTALIPAATKPMNSTSWFGRQVNSGDVVKTFSAGILLTVIPWMAGLSTGILFPDTYMGAWGESNPFSYTNPSAESGEDLYRMLFITFFQTFGLIMLIYTTMSVRKFGDQQSGKPFTVGKFIVLLLVSAAMLRPVITAELFAGIVPMLSPVAELLSGNEGI